MRLWIVLCVPTFRNMFSFFCNVRKCYFLSEKKKTLLIKEGKWAGKGYLSGQKQPLSITALCGAES